MCQCEVGQHSLSFSSSRVHCRRSQGCASGGDVRVSGTCPAVQGCVRSSPGGHVGCMRIAWFSAVVRSMTASYVQLLCDAGTDFAFALHGWVLVCSLPCRSCSATVLEVLTHFLREDGTSDPEVDFILLSGVSWCGEV